MKLNNLKRYPIVLIGACILFFNLVITSCGNNQTASTTQTDTTETPTIKTPFSADSCYTFIAKQVSFGPRVPGSKAHQECGDWIVAKLKNWGINVKEQIATTKGADGKKTKIRNIIGSFKPEAKKRILLLAHWDTRPWADQDPNPENHKKPIDGADDGGSGVGMLMELARCFAQDSTYSLGVDFLFVDLEDGGDAGSDNGWCIGSEYWAKHPHILNYQALFGVLYDMVGGKDAKFYWESISLEYAPGILSGFWQNAAKIGFGNYFISGTGGQLIDDHVPVNKYLGIPTIDIVNFNPNSDGFGSHWHTMKDNMEVISKNTLEAVGASSWTYFQEAQKNL